MEEVKVVDEEGGAMVGEVGRWGDNGKGSCEDS
jgi:hypothetical protein